jgi:hypothetical protein
MRRREFIAGLGGVAVVPLAARAQSRLSHIIVRFTPKSGHGPEHARCPLSARSRAPLLSPPASRSRGLILRVCTLSFAIVRCRTLAHGDEGSSMRS